MKSCWTTLALFALFLCCLSTIAVADPVTVRVTNQPEWSQTGVPVIAHHKYLIEAKGTWSYGGICGQADADGRGHSFICFGLPLVPDTSVAALAGRFGAQGSPFLVGSTLAWTAPENGTLYFGANTYDPIPGDNTGALMVSVSDLSPAPTVKVFPPMPSPEPTSLDKSPDPIQMTGPRVALVIGNSAYDGAALANPANDARLMAETLSSIGFEVLSGIDVDQKQMKVLLRQFGERLEKAGHEAVGLFFFAGHGVQVGGRNYLIPLKTVIEREADVDIEAVAADTVLSAMAFAGNRLNFIVLDACRNNPFKRSFRSTVRGLARMDAARGTLIAYSTSPGDVALDGDGANSPYTLALAQAIADKGVPVERMFREVRNQVMNSTSDKQVPWESSSLTGGDFYFRP